MFALFYIIYIYKVNDVFQGYKTCQDDLYYDDAIHSFKGRISKENPNIRAFVSMIREQVLFLSKNTNLSAYISHIISSMLHLNTHPGNTQVLLMCFESVYGHAGTSYM